MIKKLKLIPKFKDEERTFWATHDSTEYIDWKKTHKIESRRIAQLLADNLKRNLEEKYKPIPEKDCVHTKWCDCKNCKKCGGTT